MSTLDRLLRAATSLVREVTRGQRREQRRDALQPRTDPSSYGGGQPGTTVEYHGALPPLAYEPRPDDRADPGEVVWAWVPYEENDGRGKDRPVLVIARHDSGYLGLQTTSKDHDRDRAEEERWGRHWFDLGSGGWDRQGRESEVRLDRVLYLPPDAVRREGAGLDRARYDAVVRALMALS